MAGRPKRPLHADAWEARWVEGDAPWDLGLPAPPFVAALDRGLIAGPGRALVPGCGAGWDAILLARHGFDVAAVDLSSTALDTARSHAATSKVEIDVREADLFALPEDLHGNDLVLEHCCFCAVDPGLRDDYVHAVADALRPGGRFLGLFRMFEQEEGPPFGSTVDEIFHRFTPRFSVDFVEFPLESDRCPHGQEWLFRMTRR